MGGVKALDRLGGKGFERIRVGVALPKVRRAGTSVRPNEGRQEGGSKWHVFFHFPIYFLGLHAAFLTSNACLLLMMRLDGKRVRCIPKTAVPYNVR